VELSKLAEARQERGLSQEQVASAIEVDVSTISRWECGETLPRGANRHKLCTFFGKTAAQLGLAREERTICLPQNTFFKALAEDLPARLLGLAFLPHMSYQEIHDKILRISEDYMQNYPSRRDVLTGALACLITFPNDKRRFWWRAA